MRCLSLRRCASSDYCGNPCGQQRSRSGDSSRRCNTSCETVAHLPVGMGPSLGGGWVRRDAVPGVSVDSADGVKHGVVGSADGPMRRSATGSRVRAASSRVTVPNRLGSPGSANMTWVWNSSPCSLMMVCPTSTGIMRPSAVSEGGVLSTGTPRRSSVALGTAV